MWTLEELAQCERCGKLTWLIEGVTVVEVELYPGSYFEPPEWEVVVHCFDCRWQVELRERDYQAILSECDLEYEEFDVYMGDGSDGTV